MRPVQTANSLRRSYNKAIDGDASGDPYTSMYQQAFGNSKQSQGNNQRIETAARQHKSRDHRYSQKELNKYSTPKEKRNGSKRLLVR